MLKIIPSLLSMHTCTHPELRRPHPSANPFHTCMLTRTCICPHTSVHTQFLIPVCSGGTKGFLPFLISESHSELNFSWLLFRLSSIHCLSCTLFLDEGVILVERRQVHVAYIWLWISLQYLTIKQTQQHTNTHTNIHAHTDKRIHAHKQTHTQTHTQKHTRDVLS